MKRFIGFGLAMVLVFGIVSSALAAWDETKDNYTMGKVGIGKATPVYQLDVAGAVNANGYLMNGIDFVKFITDIIDARVKSGPTAQATPATLQTTVNDLMTQVNGLKTTSSAQQQKIDGLQKQTDSLKIEVTAMKASIAVMKQTITGLSAGKATVTK